MESEKNKLKTLFLPFIGILALIILVLLGQTVNLIAGAFRINVILGWAVSLLVLTVIITLIAIPLFRILSFRQIPDIPQDENSPEYAAYIDTMHRAMENNVFVKSSGIEFTGEKIKDLEAAFKVMDEETDRVTFKEAKDVFLTTSVSQNGTLDGIFVFISLFRLVWRIIHMYEGRPSIKKLFYIYGNVAMTVLAARGIEDMDLIEDQVEPLIASLLGGSIMTLIPGAVPITNLIVSSVMEGSVNALLILRCGCITQRYMASLSVPDKKALRRSASLEAVGKIGIIIRENTMPIVKSFGTAVKKAASGMTPKIRIKNPWARDEHDPVTE